MNILNDIVHYDNLLNYTNVHDATNPGYKYGQHMNAKTNLHKPEEQKSGGGAKLQYAKYKDCVKKTLFKACFLMIGQQYLDPNRLRENIDIRPGFLRILVEMAKFDKKKVMEQIDLNHLIKFADLLRTKNKEFDDLFDSEIAVIEQLVGPTKK